jgi:hypothetical protein
MMRFVVLSQMVRTSTLTLTLPLTLLLALTLPLPLPLTPLADGPGTSRPTLHPPPHYNLPIAATVPTAAPTDRVALCALQVGTSSLSRRLRQMPHCSHNALSLSHCLQRPVPTDRVALCAFHCRACPPCHRRALQRPPRARALHAPCMRMRNRRACASARSGWSRTTPRAAAVTSTGGVAQPRATSEPRRPAARDAAPFRRHDTRRHLCDRRTRAAAPPDPGAAS